MVEVVPNEGAEGEVTDGNVEVPFTLLVRIVDGLVTPTPDSKGWYLYQKVNEADPGSTFLRYSLASTEELESWPGSGAVESRIDPAYEHEVVQYGGLKVPNRLLVTFTPADLAEEK